VAFSKEFAKMMDGNLDTAALPHRILTCFPILLKP